MEGEQASSGNGNSGGTPNTIDLDAAKIVNLASSGIKAISVPPDVSASEPKASASMTIGKRLTVWILTMVAGSISLLVLYLWVMDTTLGADIRHNYGKDLNRDDVALYMARRLQNFATSLKSAADDKFVASKKAAADEKALIETLKLSSVISDDEHDQLEKCQLQISAMEGRHQDELQKCLATLKRA